MRVLSYIILICFACAVLLSGQSMTIPSGGRAFTSAASNILKVQEVICQNGAGSDYNCTIAATGAGNLLVVLQGDYDANPAVATAPTNTNGDTFTSACTYQPTNFGRMTIFYTVATAGNILVTVKPALNVDSSAIITEWSGTALISPLDLCAVTQLSGTSTNPTSQIITTTQTGLVIGFDSNRISSVDTNITMNDNWTQLTRSPHTSAAATGMNGGYIINAIRSQVAYNANSDSVNSMRAIVAFKSAVVGSAPSGNSPSLYSDFENSTDGTTLTVPILIASSHGGNCTWGAGAGFTIETDAQKPTVLNATVNGVTRTAPDAGTRGLQYNMTQNPVGISNCVFKDTATSATVGVWFKTPVEAGRLGTVLQEIIGIRAAVTDFAVAQYQVDLSIVVETPSGDGAKIQLAENTWYRGTIKYVAGGTHVLKIYNISGTLLGTSSAAATGTNNPNRVTIGQGHSQVDTAGVILYDNFEADWVAAVDPLIP